jgi:hypothetical protein
MNKNRLLIVKFLQLTKMNKFMHKIYYQYLHGFNTANKDVLPALEKCLKKSQNLGTSNEGGYYEFGIFKGFSFWFAQNKAKELGLEKLRFFGFDSFEGLPTIEGVDKTRRNIFYRGQYSCSQNDVVKNLDKYGVDWSRTFLIKGFFKDSLNERIKKQHKMDKIAIALIDCDLYSSTVEVLNFIKDMLIDNSILMFDDWNCFDKDNLKGQRKALKEFLEQNSHFAAQPYFSYSLYGQTFFIFKNQTSS